MNIENKDIILTTLNSRFSHSSLSLRYLFANLKEINVYEPNSELFTINPYESIKNSFLAIEAYDDTLSENSLDRKSTRLNSSHSDRSRMPSSA